VLVNPGFARLRPDLLSDLSIEPLGKRSRRHSVDMAQPPEHQHAGMVLIRNVQLLLPATLLLVKSDLAEWLPDRWKAAQNVRLAGFA